MLKKLSMIILIVSSTHIYGMDSCKDAKNYGMAAAVSSAITCHGMKRGLQSSLRYMAQPHFVYGYGAGFVSVLLLTVTAKESYNCYRVSKQQK